ILKNAVERGEITERTTVVESSSGNFATSLATFCRSLGIPFVPVIDANCNALTESVLRSCCERVEKVTDPGPHGHLTARLARVAELREEIPDVYWPNQYANTDAADAHYQTTGNELSGSFARLDYLFVAVATGGTIAGLSRRIKEQFPAATVVVPPPALSACSWASPSAPPSPVCPGGSRSSSPPRPPWPSTCSAPSRSAAIRAGATPPASGPASCPRSSTAPSSTTWSASASTRPSSAAAPCTPTTACTRAVRPAACTRRSAGTSPSTRRPPGSGPPPSSSAPTAASPTRRPSTTPPGWSAPSARTRWPPPPPDQIGRASCRGTV